MLNKLFVFDIETIPDDNVVHNLTGFESDNIQERREELTNYHLDITNGSNSFPRQLFHKIVAISFVEVDIEKYNNKEYYNLVTVRSGGNIDSSEADLIKGFFSYIRNNHPRLVTYNGRMFDIPVLKYRAMKYGITAEKFYSLGDKWNNYNQRYSSDWHCDLIEVLSDYGTSAKVKMNEVCAILNIPGKIGIDGSKVTDLYDEGKLQEIRDYCETDVINTYLIYLKYALHRGLTDKTNYQQSIQQLLSFLEDNLDKEHIKEYYNSWNELR